MSIAQPSANQVANIYQGNPGALNARIQQDQKGKPGLPPDLTKLMALNINTNEQDAAKRQQAMTALQSMQQQGGGEPPTVAQTIQQQAMQKAQLMQQQMQQQQPKPQGLMALLQQRGMPQEPENAPRPDRQPSGIDELESNVGQNFDGGGIVAFSKPTEENNNSLVEDPYKRKEGESFDDFRSRVLAIDQAAIQDRLKQERDATERARLEALASRGGAAIPPNAFGIKRGAGLPALAEQAAAVPGAPMDAESQKLANLAASQSQTGVNTNPALKPVAPAPANKPNITNLLANQQPPKPAAPPKPVNPVEPAAAAPAPSSALDKFLESALRDPAAMRDESIQRMAKAFGDPDTSAQEKYIKQLDESRARFAEPTDFAGRLSAWARNTANAGGRSSLETGSKGAAANYAEQQSNAQRNMDILKELMGETSKVADIKRGYKKELFGFGEKTYDDAYKVGMDAAKELKLDKRQAELFAHQAAEKALDRKSAQTIAGMKGAEERFFDKFAAGWLAKDENKGKSITDAFDAYNTSKQGYKPEQARVGMIEKYAKDWSTMEMMDKMKYNKDGINNAEDYVKYMMRITEQAKPGASVTGAPITKAQYDALPKGASYTAPDGSQRIKG